MKLRILTCSAPHNKQREIRQSVLKSGEIDKTTEREQEKADESRSLQVNRESCQVYNLGI